MILFIILSIIALIALVGAVITLVLGGASFLLVFGDLIVCVMLVAFIVKCLFGKKV